MILKLNVAAVMFSDSTFVVNIDKRHPEGIDELKTGDQATLKGFCSGFLMDVQIIDAGLVK